MSTTPITSKSALVDAHCHIDLYDDPAKVVAEANEHGVYTIAVTNAPSVFRYTAALTANSRFVRAAVGLHPELVGSHAHERDLLWQILPDTRYVGEIGLDYTTLDEDVRRAQREVLRQVLDHCASYGNKVLTVHSRRSAADVISAIGPCYPGKVILHWFTGGTKELEMALEYGFYFSINPAMVRSMKGRKSIDRIPKDQVLTETDGPFVRVGSRPARPWDAVEAVTQLAEIWQLSVEATQERIFENFRKVQE